MKTEVVVVRGSRRGRRGYIYGGLTNLHPLATKKPVFFGKSTVVNILVEDLAIASCQLNLFEEDARDDASDDATRFSRGG